MSEIATKYFNELDLKKLKLIHNSLKKASHLNDQKKWLDNKEHSMHTSSKLVEIIFYTE